MFYSDYGVFAYRPRPSRWLTLFAWHYDEWCNGWFVRTVGYGEIVWC